MFERETRIVLTGGGTGGHIFPLLAVAEELWQFARTNNLRFRLYYIGPIEGPFSPSRDVFLQHGVIVCPIHAGSWASTRFSGAAQLLIGLFQSLWRLLVIMPDAIFSKGGYGAVPVIFARAIYRIPLFVHESDAIPGRVTVMSAKSAARIAVSFERSLSYFPQAKTALVGNPIRSEFLHATDGKAQALQFFGFDAARKTILVLGGSQGARALNEIILDLLPQLIARYQIIHQCGPKNFREVDNEAKSVLNNLGDGSFERAYKLYGFLDVENFIDAYRAADLVIARAGAGTIFETALMGKPTLLIPLASSSQDHQRENAYAYAASGAAAVIEEENLKPHILMREVEQLLSDEPRMQKMQDAAKNFAKPDAAKLIAQELLLLAGVRV